MIIGKRCVVPYWFDYRCNTRHRWVGRNLFEVITSEFPACSEDFLVCVLYNSI